MKKVCSIVLSIGLILGCLFAVTGCGKKDNTTVISYTNGKGIWKVSVPKDDKGNAKYTFTEEKPKEISTGASFYLVTDKAVLGFMTAGMSYNTSKVYKEKHGETKATFDGYLEFINSEDFNKKSLLPGCEELELNGRKAIRYYNRAGSSSDMKYYGYFYLIGVDDIYTGSRGEMIVNYKTEDRPKEIKEFDDETMAIVNSLKIEAVNK